MNRLPANPGGERSRDDRPDDVRYGKAREDRRDVALLDAERAHVRWEKCREPAGTATSAGSTCGGHAAAPAHLSFLQ